MNDYDAEVLDLIKLSLWRRGSVEVDERVFEELKSHALTASVSIKHKYFFHECRPLWIAENQARMLYQQAA